MAFHRLVFNKLARPALLINLVSKITLLIEKYTNFDQEK